MSWFTANDGRAGIDAFHAAETRGDSFAAVITDLGMPYVDGRKVATAIKAASPSTAGDPADRLGAAAPVRRRRTGPRRPGPQQAAEHFVSFERPWLNTVDLP